jgi:hypothetical protein
VRSWLSRIRTTDEHSAAKPQPKIADSQSQIAGCTADKRIAQAEEILMDGSTARQSRNRTWQVANGISGRRKPGEAMSEPAGGQVQAACTPSAQEVPSCCPLVSPLVSGGNFGGFAAAPARPSILLTTLAWPLFKQPCVLLFTCQAGLVPQAHHRRLEEADLPAVAGDLELDLRSARTRLTRREGRA